MSELFDSDRPSASERAAETEFARAKPATNSKQYEKITEDLKAMHAYGEVAAKENAKEALEELYRNEFPIDDPPDSYERYEAEMAVRALRNSVESLTHRGRKTKILVDVYNLDGDIDDAVVDEASVTEMPADDEVINRVVTEHHVEIAKSSIDLMATYGQLAESHIATLAQVGLPSEVRQHAIETLAEMREETNESKSLTAAIRDWWHGE